MVSMVVRSNMSLRAMLGERLAMLALLLGSTQLVSLPLSAQTACSFEGAAQTCTGDQAQGVVATTPVTTLIVEDLTADIRPEWGQNGIGYETETSAALFSESGDFALYSRGATGIVVGARGGDVYLHHTGDINAFRGRGIMAYAHAGGVVIEGAGNISSSFTAISSDPRLGDAVLNWTGSIRSRHGHAIDLRADNGAVDVTGSGALEAARDAVLLQAKGDEARATFNWTGDVTSHEGRGVVLTADNGGVSATGSGTISAQGDGVRLQAHGEGAHSFFAWNGAITSGTGTAVTLSALNGSAWASGSGAVSGQAGFALEARGEGAHANLSWSGAVSASAGHAISVYAANGGADASGSGPVWASGTAIRIQTDSSDNHASLNWAGDISSTTGAGAEVQAQGGDATLRGSGQVNAATEGLFARSSTGNTQIQWTGNVSGGTEGIQAYSARGAITVQGTGNVAGQTQAFLLENEGHASSVLIWNGAISSTGENSIYISSARGAVTSSTEGTITSSGGGIYARTSSDSRNQTVHVSHLGNMTVAGVGVEVRSPGTALNVTMQGDLDAGSYGVYAESVGDGTVSIEHTGRILSGHTALHAFSSTGSVSVLQSGSILSYGRGISAQNTGSATVYVEKTGQIVAVEDGINAQSPLGNVAVRVLEGDIRSTSGSGIVAGNTGNNGVTVEVTGDIAALMDGVQARSANGHVYAVVNGQVESGRDGISVLSEGSGSVGITHSGTVTAGGDGLVASTATGTAVVSVTEGSVSAAQSGIRLQGYGEFLATVGAGATVTGGAGAAGVWFEGGMVNNLANYGVIKNAGGLNDYAVLSSFGESYVKNYGQISGNVSLGPWANDFNNYAGALLESGSILNLGADQYFHNAGTIAPGGLGGITTTALTGNLTTTNTSTLAFDVDMATSRADQLAISGTAALAGSVALSFNSLSSATQSYDLVTAGSGLSAQSLTLISNRFLTSRLATTADGHNLTLSVSDLNFAAEGVTRAGQGIGDYLNRAFGAGGQGLESLGKMIVNSGTLEEANQIYDALTPGVMVGALNSGGVQAQGFTDGLMSCAVPSGLNAALREGSCDWTRLEFSNSHRQSPTSGTTKSHGFTVHQGIQRPIGDSDWRMGVAFGVSNTIARNDLGGRAETTRIHAGVSLKYNYGQALFAAALGGSWGEMETTRDISLGGMGQTLKGSTGVQSYNLKLRGAYYLGSDDFYVIPQIDLNSAYMKANAYSEAGGSAALDMGRISKTSFTAVAAVELGTNRRAQNGDVLRAFARIGRSFSSHQGATLSSSLASDQTNVAGAKLGTGGDRQLWTLSAGITAFTLSGWSAETRVNFAFGDETRDQQASIKIRKSF